MADGIVQFLVEKLASLLQEEAKLLGGVRQDAQYMRDEMERMTAFLRLADAREGSDPLLKVWVNQVREVAYDTEDVLDEFIFHLAHHHDGEGFYGSLRRIFCYVKKLKARSQIASQIQRLKVRVRDIAEGHQRYRLDSNFPLQSSSVNIAATRIPYDVQREADLVGIEKPKQQLVTWLLNPGSRLQCISVVGMGGSGKTTLVKKVYDDSLVKNHFQSHLWLVVSQSFNLNELLRDIIQQLFYEVRQPPPQGVESMSRHQLKGIIDEFLQQRRFLLVIDDVWSISASEVVRAIVPDNDCGSRFMLTTRINDVASTSQVQTNGMVYTSKALSQEESWILFCRKAFPESCLCPTPLQEISQRILSRCEGLPLAIVVIGGVLATKNKSRIEEWEMFYRSLPSEFDINERLERLKRLLCLGYYDLPYYLKLCFLYMSLFPEDEEMGKMRLIRLWIAEGFVRARKGMSIEDVAEEYLNELINRSLVQVGGEISTHAGRLKSCRLHDLLREMILSISMEQRFFMVASGSTTEWPEMVRRLAIHEDAEIFQVSRKYSNRLRSLITFGNHDSPFMSQLPLPVLLRSKFLKVLDLTDAPLDKIPQELFGLVHLRYLSLRDTKVSTIPRLIGNLEKLETLDLKSTCVTCVPKEIVKLVRLRHLLAFSHIGFDLYDINGFKAPSNMGALFSLQKLCYIDVSENHEAVLREIGKLSQLRKLGIVKLRREDGMTLCSSISKLTNLRSLYLNSPRREGEEVLNLESLPALPFLERFELVGRFDKAPDWISSFPSLIVVRLYECRLKDVSDLLTNSIQALPNLLQLLLSDASDGDSLLFKAGGFQRLTLLEILRFKGLKTVTIEEGAMPHLDSLLIEECKLLDVLPFGIEHLTKLGHLSLGNMPSKLIDPLQHKDKEHRGGDYWRIEHVPQVSIYNWENDG